jgi:multidrug transporter EmrE-like cation transporter
MKMKKNGTNSLIMLCIRMKSIALRCLAIVFPVLAAFVLFASERSAKHIAVAVVFILIGIGSLFAAKAYKQLYEHGAP